MKINIKLIAKILFLVVIFSVFAVILTGCEATPNDGVNEGLATISGGLLGSLIVFMWSILLAIASAFGAIFSIIAGLFQLIGELIASFF